MAVFECTVCGGGLEVQENSVVGTCPYCGSTMTLPNALDDKKAYLFNRANHFRMQNNFDRAEEAYEEILKEYGEDAETYWGIVLCRYGIEYVEDPKTGERVPTCHRANTASVLEDPDYRKALEHSSDEARQAYETEAARIDEIHKDILAISRDEAPYDVFICYKEKDASGEQRTKDSVLAQDIYTALSAQNLRVFFARITLEEKLGKAYEPYIFAALNSAKVMIVVGTSEENLTAVWVRNEWSRFLALMKNDHTKVLIPVYADMDAYDLPREFGYLQAQDANKIGFLQDLTRGILKIVVPIEQPVQQQPVESQAQPPVQPVPSGYADAEPDGAYAANRLVKNAETFIRLNEADKAYEIYQKMTYDFPEDYRGWWGLIVMMTHGFRDDSQWEQTEKLFKNVKNTASPKEYAAIAPQYEQYVKAAALARADAVIGDMRKELNEQKNTVQQINRAMGNAKDQIASRQREMDKLGNESLNEPLRSAIQQKSALSRRRFLRVCAKLFFWALLIVCILTPLATNTAIVRVIDRYLPGMSDSIYELPGLQAVYGFLRQLGIRDLQMFSLIGLIVAVLALLFLKKRKNTRYRAAGLDDRISDIRSDSRARQQSLASEIEDFKRIVSDNQRQLTIYQSKVNQLEAKINSGRELIAGQILRDRGYGQSTPN